MPKDILESGGVAKAQVFDVNFPPLHNAQKEVHDRS